MLGIKTKLKRSAARFFAALYKSPKDKSIDELLLNTKYKLCIPTYEKSGQVVHPDILLRGDSPKYVLAFTPYPNTNDKYENPSIVVSDDGLCFKEERDGINPLVPAPAKDHNDDPDLTFYEGTYQMLYLETLRPVCQNLMLLTSKDRLNWKKEILRQERIDADRPQFMLSPALVYASNECFLFAVNKDISSKNSLYAVKGSGVRSLEFSCKLPLALNGVAEDLQPWHVDVFNDGAGGYVMLLCMVTPYSAKKRRYALFAATSKNLIDWDFKKDPLLKNVYRSSGFVRNGVLHIYFSTNIYADVWTTGLYKVAL